MNAALLLTALFNGAWQGALLCGGAMLVFRLFRRLNATTMFTVWSVLLLIAVFLPFANYVFAPKPYTVHVKVAPIAVTARISEPVHRSTVGVRTPLVYHLAQSQPTLRERAASIADAVYAHADIGLWLLLLIALIRIAVLGRDIVHMLAARKRVRLIDAPVSLDAAIARPFKFAASNDFTSPCVLGFVPALIVLPEELLDEAPAKLHSIVLHEREHVRRFDDVQNVVQRFIGAVAFFCPGVRIALRELALYREQICDDAAIDGTGDRVSYAMTLTRMSQWAQGRGTPVPSLIFKRKQLLHRLEVLLDSAVSHSLRMNRRFAIGAVCTLALAALLVLRVQVPVIAESIVAPAPPPPPHVAFPVKHMRVVHVAPVAPAAPAPTAKTVKPAKPAKPVPQAPKVAKVKALRPPAPKTPKITAIALTPQNVPEASAVAQAAVAPVPPPTHWHAHEDDLLDTLNAVGLRNLTVDQLIAIRDHGVNTPLIRAAVSYFGGALSVNDLTSMADRGVSASYLEALRSEGVSGIAPASVEMLMDHGVSARLIRAAMAYFSPRPSAADLTYLSDHGVSEECIEGFARAGLTGVSPADVARLVDHGVNASYVAKVRRMNPRAGVDDIIRLHDAGV